MIPRSSNCRCSFCVTMNMTDAKRVNPMLFLQFITGAYYVPGVIFLLIYHCLTMAFLFNDYRSFLIINESNGCQRLLGSLGRKSMTWFINTCNSLYIISPTTSQTLRSLVSKLGRWYLLKLGFHFLIKFVFLQWKSIKNNENCFLFHI